MKDEEIVLIGHIGVDSGMVFIDDPCYMVPSHPMPWQCGNCKQYYAQQTNCQCQVNKSLVDFYFEALCKTEEKKKEVQQPRSYKFQTKERNMSKIYKYFLDVSQKINAVNVPEDSDFLAFQVQNDAPVIWMRVTSDEDCHKVGKLVERLFQLVPTGEDFDCDNKDYLGTVQLGPIVLHLYEIERE